MTAAAVYSFTSHMVSAGACIDCGVEICMPQNLKTQRLRDQKTFYCCNGHSQCYVGKTEEQKLREALDAEKQAREADVTYERMRRADAERSAAAYRGQVTAIKNRVSNGVCPCCKRTFKQLAAHMACKHPDYKSETT